MRPQTVDRSRRIAIAATLITWPILLYLTWFVAPDWSYQPDVTAPLTRKILFFHPASAWASFAAYFVVFALSIAVLNERQMKYDAPARAAAEVGFAMNTVALVTGTLWGLQEWSKAGTPALVTVYSEPKVLVVLVLWFIFAAYLALRKLVDAPERRARLAAAFGVLGFLAVPMSFASSRLLATSLHPDVAGPGKNADAALGSTVGWILAFSAVSFLALFIALWLTRLRLLRAEERIHASRSGVGGHTMNDATTFFLAFTGVFVIIAAVMVHLELRAKALEARLATLEATTAKPKDLQADSRVKP